MPAEELGKHATGVHRRVAQNAVTAPKFLIADDHRFVCEALAVMIRQNWPEAVIEQTESFDDAMLRLGESACDVAILDFCMPGMNGGASIARMRTLHPGLKIVILSGAIEPAEALQALTQGVVAYVPKSIAGDSIIHVLTLVLDGETYVPRVLIDAIAQKELAPTARDTAHPGLSERDTALLHALVKGYPNKVIAHSMGVSESTVKLYLHKLFKTLGVHNRTEAVARGLHQIRVNGGEHH